MKVLLTGFDPFGGETINPAWELVQRLAEKGEEGIDLSKRKLPTVFGKAIEEIIQAVSQINPQVVLAVGQAGGRAAISLERVAINIDDANMADNEQKQPRDTPIIAGGPTAYFSTLPIKAMAQGIQKTGIPATISNSAGTFVCNHLFYGLLHHLAENKLPIRAGFIHIPYLPEQAVHHKNAPSMNLGDMVTAFLAVLRVLKNKP